MAIAHVMTIAPLSELISQVPNVVWSGLIASLLTLTGVFISNASNTKRLKVQLAHDASEKAKERTGKLRQEVYLLVAEELGKANKLLGSMGSVDLLQGSPLDDMQGLFSAANKLQLVAEPQTALLVGELNASYGAAVLRLLTASNPLRKNRMHIEITSKLYEQMREQVEHYQAAMSDLIDSGQVDEREYKHIKDRLDFHSAQMEKYAEERNALWEENTGLHMQFVQMLINEMKPLNAMYVSAIMAIRSDLGLPAERREFEEQMMNQWKIMENELNNALAALKNQDDT